MKCPKKTVEGTTNTYRIYESLGSEAYGSETQATQKDGFMFDGESPTACLQALMHHVYQKAVHRVPQFGDKVRDLFKDEIPDGSTINGSYRINPNLTEWTSFYECQGDPYMTEEQFITKLERLTHRLQAACTLKSNGMLTVDLMDALVKSGKHPFTNAVRPDQAQLEESKQIKAFKDKTYCRSNDVARNFLWNNGNNIENAVVDYYNTQDNPFWSDMMGGRNQLSSVGTIEGQEPSLGGTHDEDFEGNDDKSESQETVGEHRKSQEHESDEDDLDEAMRRSLDESESQETVAAQFTLLKATPPPSGPLLKSNALEFALNESKIVTAAEEDKRKLVDEFMKDAPFFLHGTLQIFETRSYNKQ